MVRLLVGNGCQRSEARFPAEFCPGDRSTKRPGSSKEREADDHEGADPGENVE
jgi:hypothetical protein